MVDILARIRVMRAKQIDKKLKRLKPGSVEQQGCMCEITVISENILSLAGFRKPIRFRNRYLYNQARLIVSWLLCEACEVEDVLSLNLLITLLGMADDIRSMCESYYQLECGIIFGDDNLSHLRRVIFNESRTEVLEQSRELCFALNQFKGYMDSEEKQDIPHLIGLVQYRKYKTMKKKDTKKRSYEEAEVFESKETEEAEINIEKEILPNGNMVFYPKTEDKANNEVCAYENKGQ